MSPSQSGTIRRGLPEPEQHCCVFKVSPANSMSRIMRWRNGKTVQLCACSGSGEGSATQLQCDLLFDAVMTNPPRKETILPDHDGRDAWRIRRVRRGITKDVAADEASKSPTGPDQMVLYSITRRSRLVQAELMEVDQLHQAPKLPARGIFQSCG